MSAEMRAFLLGMIGVPLMLLGLVVAVYGGETAAILAMVAARSPMLLTGSADFTTVSGGFAANIVISLWAMLLALIGGFALGWGMIAQGRAVRLACGMAMNVLRNSPWLVVLYAMLYLLPFEVRFLGKTIMFPPAVKAVFGLGLPVMAYVAEVFRGGVEAVPAGQWESARALGYRRLQILRHVVLPQALPMMTPNLMSTYAALFIGTSLIVVTGTNDVLSIARAIIASEGDRVATAIYVFVLFLFFVFCFPIAIATRWLERRIRGWTQ